MDKKIAIRQAKAAAAKNDYPAAQAILKNILREDPNSMEAWLVLARVVDNEAYKRECLDRVLFFDPENAEALKHLNELDDPLTDLYSFAETEEEQALDIDLELPNAYETIGEGLPGIKPKTSVEPAKVDEPPKQRPAKSKPKKKKKQKKSTSRAFELGLVVVILVLIVAVIVIVLLQNNNLLNF